ncbi:MAG: 16S rRNA (guanine(527)-N(7))-methyltransferase RsmG [Anaerolineales bacterium]
MQPFVQFAYQILGIQLTAKQIFAFQRYEELLLSWSKHTNLTAIRDPEMIAIKHFLDSLTCMLALRDTAINRVVDVGTGAGFPGIPLKIINPAMELTLIESVEKKASFCRAVIAELNLKGVTIIADRVEKVAHQADHREGYDWAIARAVASMPTLMEYLLPLVKVGGSALAMKGESAPLEAHQAEHACQILGGRLRKLIPIHLPKISEDRYLVLVDKIACTPEGYPRRPGIPEKRPLI